ncbi:MAG: PilZ domain-containing protein [Thermodesulfovibrionales bacterium]
MAAERSSDRTPFHALISYTVVVLKDGRLKFLDLTGKAINISRTGLCFVTRYPLKTGYVLEFKHRVRESSHGVVMWIRNLGSCYIAGTQLITRNTE